MVPPIQYFSHPNSKNTSNRWVRVIYFNNKEELDILIVKEVDETLASGLESFENLTDKILHQLR